MKKFEDSKIFGNGSDIVGVYPINMDEELSELSNEMWDFEEAHRPGIQREPEYMPRPGGRGYFTKDYKRIIKG
jgi:hypothetical protein